MLRVLESHRGFDAPPSPPFTVPSSSDAEDQISRTTRVLQGLISQTPIHRDELLRLADAPAWVALVSLSELEIAGLIHSDEGGYYSKG